LTRAEAEILRAHTPALAGQFSGSIALVELGSGSAVKTRVLIEAFLARQRILRYVPIDISPAALAESSGRLLQDYPALEITAVVAEYHKGLGHLRGRHDQPRLILWLGSNVGNFHRDEAAAFLAEVRRTMTAADRLLVGIDLRKDRSILEAAYDDSRGVTAGFNLNLLRRINRELGGHFNPEAFRHRAVYNEQAGRVEMYLDSREDQRVRLDRLDLEVAFAAGEPIHTENSYKYSFAEIEALAAAAGLRVEAQWLDSEKRFSANLLAAARAPSRARSESSSAGSGG
jgi:L-histidine N-alpha-methyltransferase